ncbi:DUF3624 domain-containing protein [Salinivibrio costicola]|uniref:DUF3624 domain-containing protein n=1 Tax=Salinivibrio costicola TaxID=51367 RepID=UPI003F71EB7D
MACKYCQSGIWKQKLGRCTRCMTQLAVISAILWPFWWWTYADTPRQVESIALLFAAGSASALLLLHLLIYPFRRNRKRP